MSNLLTQLVYLSGPMTGLSYRESAVWRSYVSEKLPKWIQCISPLRDIEGMDEEEIILDSYKNSPLSTQKGITRRDRNDVRRSNLILVNLLGAKRVTIGTVIELGWADILDKLVVLVMEDEGNIHDHPILREIASFRTNTLDKAIEVVVNLLAPNTFQERKKSARSARRKVKPFTRKILAVKNIKDKKRPSQPKVTNAARIRKVIARKAKFGRRKK